MMQTNKEETSGKHKLIRLVKEYGSKKGSIAVGGVDNLLMILNIKTPMGFLHLFDGLDVVQSKDEKDWTLFHYKPKHNLMIYDRKNDIVYINYYEIWSVLEDKFGLNDSEIEQLTKEWLNTTYNLGDNIKIKDTLWISRT